MGCVHPVSRLLQVVLGVDLQVAAVVIPEGRPAVHLVRQHVVVANVGQHVVRLRDHHLVDLHRIQLTPEVQLGLNLLRPGLC